MPGAMDQLNHRLADIDALHAAVGMLDWDQQTYMPPGGGEARAAQVSRLSRMAHEAFVAEETRSALERAAAEGGDPATLRVVARDLEIATKFPSELVARESELAAKGHDVWVQARKDNAYPKFAPILAEFVEIAKEKASLIGYDDHPYTALLDMYEEGATHGQCVAMFGEIREPLVALVAELKSVPVDDSFLHGSWEESRQREFSIMLLKQIGFDLERGRLDTAPHPFCTGWSIGDVRLTTRYKSYLPSAIFGTLHEAGHGMYEQGSPMEWDRTPLAGGVSLGVHESQSRLWENIVGRSLPFMEWMRPRLLEAFPALGSPDAATLTRAINKVEPSLIRVEADEVTYNLHIMVRFEVECALLESKLAVQDLPEFWNAKYEEYLSVRPPTDSDGCLQDVHWSMGSIGYFPTYTMGNLLSYQIWNALLQDVPDAESQIGRGEFGAILGWLSEQIYSKGQSIPPQELVKLVTGRPMGADDYLAGISQKYRSIFGTAKAT